MEAKLLQVKAFFKVWFKRKSIRYGAPFLLCIVGGSFGLKEFAQLRYTFSQTKSIKRDEMQNEGLKLKDQSETTIEAQYERIKTLDIDNWEQVRGPRPWEETTATTS